MTELRALHRRAMEARYAERRSKTRENHQYPREQPPETTTTTYAPPNLIKVYSEASSSSRSRETHPEQDHPNRCKKGQVGRRNHKDDDSIIRGAQILRQQLMIVDDDYGYESNDEALKLGHIHESTSGWHSHQQQQRSGHVSPRHHHQNVPEEDASTSSDDWIAEETVDFEFDPWNVCRRTMISPVQEESQESQSQVSEPLITPKWQKREPSEEDDSNTHSEMQAKYSFDTKGDASKWAQLSDDEGEDDADVTPEPMDPEDSTNLFALSDTEEEVEEDFFATPLHRYTPPPPPPPAPEEGDTPETCMGRNRSLRTKVQTYIVQRVDEMDTSTDDSSYYQDSYPPAAPVCSYLPNALCVDTSPNTPGPKIAGPESTSTYDSSYDQDLSHYQHSFPPAAPACSYLPNELFLNRSPNVPGPKMAGPESPSGFPTLRPWECNADSLDLLQDIKNDEEALKELETRGCHMNLLLQNKRDFLLPPPIQQQAQEQDEISPCQHVVSPNSPLYLDLIGDPAYLHAQRAGNLWQSLVSQHVRFPSKWWNGARGPPLGIGERRSWNYHGRHRIQANDVLNSFVTNRGSAGRILLHIIVRDLMTMQPVHDIAIGCFHPNARGVRASSAFSPEIEDCRDVWLAVRRRNDEISVTETLLKKTSSADADASPLGSRKSAVHNQNMRVVFGELPPMQTIFVMENELYEILSEHKDGALPPAVVLVQQFLR